MYEDDIESILDDYDDEGYLEDDDDETYYADDDDDEAIFDDDEGADQAERRYFRRKRKSSRRRGGYRARGRRSFRFGSSRRPATNRTVKRATQVLAKDNARQEKAIAKVTKVQNVQDTKLVKFEKSLNKRLKDLESKAQLSGLLPLLMKSEPQVKSLTDEAGNTVNFKNKTTSYHSGDSSDLLPLLLLSGGMGGSSSGNNSNSMLQNPIALIALMKAFD
jgi:hypothetical protein